MKNLKNYLGAGLITAGSLFFLTFNLGSYNGMKGRLEEEPDSVKAYEILAKFMDNYKKPGFFERLDFGSYLAAKEFYEEGVKKAEKEMENLEKQLDKLVSKECGCLKKIGLENKELNLLGCYDIDKDSIPECFYITSDNKELVYYKQNDDGHGISFIKKVELK